MNTASIQAEMSAISGSATPASTAERIGNIARNLADVNERVSKLSLSLSEKIVSISGSGHMPPSPVQSDKQGDSSLLGFVESDLTTLFSHITNLESISGSL